MSIQKDCNKVRANEANVRLVIFTSLNIEETVWWPIIASTPSLQEVLICRKLVPQDRASILRRVKRNIQKHGLIFIPYRIYHLAKAILRLTARKNKFIPPDSPDIPVEVLEAENIHSAETITQVRDWKPDLGLSISAPILKESLYRTPKNGTINVHCAKLPDFRGAPPGFWEISEGAKEIGASVHWVDDGLDTGDVIGHATANIYSHDRVVDVEARALELGRYVLASVLENLLAGRVVAIPQGTEGVTFKQPLVTQRVKVHCKNLLARYQHWGQGRGRWSKLIICYLVLFLFRPLRDLWRTINSTHPIHIFTFHRVTNLCRDGMTISPDKFAQQLRYILKSHEAISANKAIELLRLKKGFRRPYAVFTFDDGYRSVFDSARPIMRDLGVTGCCFVSTDLVDTDRRFEHDSNSLVKEFLDVMSWAELRKLKDEGWDVGAHSATHARMSELNSDDLAYEVNAPIKALKKQLDIEDIMVAYPFGLATDVPEHWQETVREAGYIANFTDIMGENFPGANVHDLARIELGGDHAALGWKVRVHGIDLGQFRNLFLSRK